MVIIDKRASTYYEDQFHITSHKVVLMGTFKFANNLNIFKASMYSNNLARHYCHCAFRSSYLYNNNKHYDSY